jgi:predicted RNase H-like nuclease (RuvC/YqgF family)
MTGLSVFLIATTFFFWRSNNDLAEKCRLAERTRDALTGKLNSLVKEKDELRGQISSLRSEQADLASAVDMYLDHTKMMNTEMDGFNRNLHELDLRLLKKDMELRELGGAIKKYEVRLTECDKEISGLKAKLDEAGKKASGVSGVLELAPIEVPVEGSPGAVSGNILEVNKEQDFVVIDAGRAQGLKAGDSLMVQRGEELLGRVILEKVDIDLSTARPLYKSLRDNVRKGDIVVL